MICRAFFLIHSSALLFVLQRTVFVLVVWTNTLVTDRTLLHVHCVTHLLHLGHAVLILHGVALLFIRGSALLVVRCYSLILGVAVLLRLCRHIRSIYSEGKQNRGKKYRVTAEEVHPF